MDPESDNLNAGNRRAVRQSALKLKPKKLGTKLLDTSDSESKSDNGDLDYDHANKQAIVDSDIELGPTPRRPLKWRRIIMESNSDGDQNDSEDEEVMVEPKVV